MIYGAHKRCASMYHYFVSTHVIFAHSPHILGCSFHTQVHTYGHWVLWRLSKKNYQHFNFSLSRICLPLALRFFSVLRLPSATGHSSAFNKQFVNASKSHFLCVPRARTGVRLTSVHVLGVKLFNVL